MAYGTTKESSLEVVASYKTLSTTLAVTKVEVEAVGVYLKLTV